MIAREYDIDKRRGRWTLYFFWAVIAGACATYAAEFFDPRPQQAVRADASPAAAQAAVPAVAPSVRALPDRQSVTLERIAQSPAPAPDRTQQTASIAPAESPPTIAAPVLQVPSGPSLVNAAQASPEQQPPPQLTATPAEPAQLAALPPAPPAPAPEPEAARVLPPRGALRTLNEDVNGRVRPGRDQPVMRRLGRDLFLIPIETRGEWTRVQVWGEDGPDSNFWMFNNLLRPIDPMTGEILSTPFRGIRAAPNPVATPARPQATPTTEN